MRNLLWAYKTALTSMDERIIHPFTEFEIQPLFAKEWMDRLIPLYQEFVPKGPVQHYFLNRSVTRSMFITDLLDNYYAYFGQQKFEENLAILKTFWRKIYNELYGSEFDGADPFSQFTNKPIGDKLHPEFYFYQTDALFETLALCFAISYAKNFDIMADNTYEITGLYHQSDKLIQKNTFHRILDHKNIVLYTWGNRPIARTEITFFQEPKHVQIDIFGHSTQNGLNSIAGFLNNVPLLNSDIPALNRALTSELNRFILRNKRAAVESKICRYLQTRLSRYKRLSVVLNIDTLTRHPGPLSPRLSKTAMEDTLALALGG